MRWKVNLSFRKDVSSGYSLRRGALNANVVMRTTSMVVESEEQGWQEKIDSELQ